MKTVRKALSLIMILTMVLSYGIAVSFDAGAGTVFAASDVEKAATSGDATDAVSDAGLGNAEDVQLTERSIKVTAEKEKLTVKDSEGKKHISKPLKAAEEFWKSLVDRQAPLMKNGEKDPVKLVITGRFPEDVTAEAKYIEFDEADEYAKYAESALFGLEIKITDKDGNNYVPEEPIIVTVKGARIKASAKADDQFRIYSVEPKAGSKDDIYADVELRLTSDNAVEFEYGYGLSLDEKAKGDDAIVDSARFMMSVQKQQPEDEIQTEEEIQDKDEAKAEALAKESKAADEAKAEDTSKENKAPDTAKAEEPVKKEEANADKNEKQTLTATDDKTYKVTVSYDESAGLPEGTQLNVVPINDDKDYDSYVDKATEAIGSDADQLNFAHVLDISLIDPETGEKVQPGSDVKVSIELPNKEIREGTDVGVVHFKEGVLQNAFGIGKGKAEVVDSKEADGTVKFESIGFSVYVVAGYTVDFHWGEYTYSIDGGDTIYLSELLKAIGSSIADTMFVDSAKLMELSEDMDRIENVEFSDPKLVKVEKKSSKQKENDWLLTSLAAFDTEEALVIILKDGSEIVIRVTDADPICIRYNSAGTQVATYSIGDRISILNYITSEKEALQVAFDNANDGDVIVLQKSIEIGTTTSSLDFDRSGKKVTLKSKNNEKFTIARDSLLGYSMLNVMSGSLTIENVIFDARNHGTSDNGSVAKLNGGNLTLGNGATLQNGKAYYVTGTTLTGHDGGGVCVASGTLVMENGSLIKDCEAGHSGGGVVVEGSNSVFIMNGGTISNCSTHEGIITTVTATNINFGKGGGVYVHKKGSFTLNGGTITGCNAQRSYKYAGGGVCVDDDKTKFTMNGGTIKNCSAPNSAGGGIAVGHTVEFVTTWEYATATINGGTITDCESANGGSAIEIHGVLNMNGGTVTRNKNTERSDGAVCFYRSGSDPFYGLLNIKGDPRVYGNANNKNVNIAEDGTNKITVVGPMSEGALVYVYGTSGNYNEGQQFGTFRQGVSTENFENFRNDRHDTYPTDILVGSDGGNSRLVWRKANFICKVVETNGSGLEHPFEKLSKALSYIRNHPDDVYSGSDPAAIQMLVDYAIPSDDNLDINGSDDNIKITTAKTESQLPSGESYYFYTTFSSADGRISGDSDSKAILIRSSNNTDSLFKVGNASAKLTTQDIILDGGSNLTTSLSCNGNGGIVNVTAGDLTVDAGTVMRNSVANSGGAIYMDGGGALNMTGTNSSDVKFSTNRATDRLTTTGDAIPVASIKGGGAVFIGTGVSANITYAKFTNNAAYIDAETVQERKFDGLGGAICTRGSSLIISHSDFNGHESWDYDNSNSSKGGAIYQGAGYTKMSYCTLYNCAVSHMETADNSSRNGGIIFSNSSDADEDGNTVTIDNCTIDGHHGANMDAFQNARDGGMAYMYNGKLYIKDSEIKNCSTYNKGGAIYSRTADITLKDSTIHGCEAITGDSPSGGAICNGSTNMAGSNGGTLILDNTKISGNKAKLQGGGVYTKNNITIKNGSIIGSSTINGVDVGGNILTDGAATDAAGLYIVNGDNDDGKTLTIGGTEAGDLTKETSKIFGNELASGEASNVRLSEISSDGPDKGKNTTNSVSVKVELDKTCKISVANAKVLFHQFGSSDVANMPVLIHDNDDFTEIFVSDDGTLFGCIDPKDTEGKKIIWYGDFICKITDASDNLLRCADSATGTFNDAVFTSLNDAFAAFNSKVFMTLSGDYVTPIKILMFVPEYDLVPNVSCKIMNKDVILSTEYRTTKEEADNYPYELKEGQEEAEPCIIKRVYENDSMLYLESSGTSTPKLTITDIVLDGGSEREIPAGNGSIIKCQKNVSLDVGRNTILRNSSSTNSGGAIYADNQNAVVTLKDGARIVNCRSSKYGGAIYLSNGKLEVKKEDEGYTGEYNAYISNCLSSDHGAGIRLDTTKECSLKKLNISGCTAGSETNRKSGGAICNMGAGKLILDACSFTGNKAYYFGGAVYNEKDNNLVLKNGTQITGNKLGLPESADAPITNAAGIYMKSGTLVLGGTESGDLAEETSHVTGNTTQDGKASNVRLKENNNVNASNSVSILSYLDKDECEIGVVNAKNEQTQFGSIDSSHAGMDILTFGNREFTKIFHADNGILFGCIDPDDSSECKVIWSCIICKITDEDGNLLTYNGQDAVFPKLKMAFDTFATATFRDANNDPSSSPKPYYIMMLIGEYPVKPGDIIKSADFSNSRDVYLTTEQRVSAQDTNNYPYTGSYTDANEIKRCTLSKASDNKEMLFNIGSKSKLTISNLIIDGKDIAVTANADHDAGLIYVSGELVLTDGAELKNANAQVINGGRGGAIYVDYTGSLTMNGSEANPAKIHNCKGRSSGAVYVAGSFTMEGYAQIYDCSAIPASGSNWGGCGGAISIGREKTTYYYGIVIQQGHSEIKNCRAVKSSSDKTGFGGAVFLEYGHYELKGDAKISGCTADVAGGGIYVSEKTTAKNAVLAGVKQSGSVRTIFRISGNPTFGAGNNANKVPVADSYKNQKNGKEEVYKDGKARQDIFIAGYKDVEVSSVEVTGKITSGDGSIWVWAEKQHHYEYGDQFAVFAGDGVSLNTKDKQTSMQAFRNARHDVETNNPLTSEAVPYLFGVAGTGNNINWGVLSTTTIKTILRKINNSHEPLSGAEFRVFNVTGSEISSEIYESGSSGVFFIGNLPVGTYYAVEVGAPSGYGSNKGKVFEYDVEANGTVKMKQIHSITDEGFEDMLEYIQDTYDELN